jgi:hypothetical protein
VTQRPFWALSTVLSSHSAQIAVGDADSDDSAWSSALFLTSPVLCQVLAHSFSCILKFHFLSSFTGCTLFTLFC